MKTVKLILWAFFILATAAGSTTRPAQPAQSTCVDYQQAGRHDFTFENGRKIIIIQYPKPFCQIPIPMAVGSEQVKSVRIGVVTPSIVTMILFGTPGDPGVIYWQAQEPTNGK